MQSPDHSHHKNHSHNAAMRNIMWKALKNDNPTRLMATLDHEAALRGVSASELMHSLEMLLWKNDGEERANSRPKGLIAVAAANVSGIPTNGATKCLKALLARFPPDDANACPSYQIKFAYHSAVHLNRHEAATLLHGHVIHHDAKLCQWV